MYFPDYPFTSRYFDRGDGIRLHYIDEAPAAPTNGAAPANTVVMVHGNPTWSFYYRRVILALRKTHRCIAPDHVGMGLSDKPGDAKYAYTLRQRIDDLEALLNSLNITQPITLIVHDWGGMIGMGYAVRHPERIARLVILNTAAFGLPAGKKMPWQLKLCRSPLGPLLVRGLNGFSRDAAKSCVKRRPLSQDAREAYLRPYNSWANRIAVMRFVQDIPLSPGHPSFADVQHIAGNLAQFRDRPMLVVWGLRDFVFDHHFLTEWTQRFPAATVHRYEDAGHYVLEDAHEEIVPLVTRFVS